MKIKVTDNNRSKPSKVGDASLSEFSEAEIESILPASDILHRINFDHVYSTSGISSLRLKYHPKESKSLPLVGRIQTKSSPCPEIPTLEKSRSEIWTDEIDDEVTSDDSLTDDASMSLNADSIQQVFQRMIDLTSLDAIANRSSNLKADDDEDKGKAVLKKVMFVDELPGTSKSSPVTSSIVVSSRSGIGETAASQRESKTPSKKSKKSTKPQKISECKSQPKCTKEQTNGKLKKSNKSKTQKQDLDTKYKPVDEDERTTAIKYAEAEREMNTLLNNTRELLVRRWGDYLCMTTEKLRTFEIENARQQKMVEDVVEMLENKDLYVWQLIDDLQFF